MLDQRTEQRWLQRAQTSRSSSVLAELAVQALRREAELTPKPGLVDRRSSGSHHDLTLNLMLASADSLGPAFQAIAEAAQGRRLSLSLREHLGALGRDAEFSMLRTTGGVNTHRGAIWTLGLLIAGSSAVGGTGSMQDVVSFAADLAAMPDRFACATESHGQQVRRNFGVGGAKQEACEGFPHVMLCGLPALWQARKAGDTETNARLLCLLAVMAELDDTCLLYRAGADLLRSTKKMAAQACRLGGARTQPGRDCLRELDRLLGSAWASPGGSADLLAAAIFLDSAFAGSPNGQGKPPCRN